MSTLKHDACPKDVTVYTIASVDATPPSKDDLSVLYGAFSYDAMHFKDKSVRLIYGGSERGNGSSWPD